MQSLEDFTNAIRIEIADNIQSFDYLDPTFNFNSDVVTREIAKCYQLNYAVYDVVNYMMCWEELNPDLDEDVALKRMARIRARYPN